MELMNHSSKADIYTSSIVYLLRLYYNKKTATLRHFTSMFNPLFLFVLLLSYFYLDYVLSLLYSVIKR